MKLKAEGEPVIAAFPSSEMIRVSEGIASVTAQIKLDPDDGFAYLMRSLLWLDKRELDIALGDTNDAVRLAREAHQAYAGRGEVRLARREYDQAIADLNEAIRLEPQAAASYNLRAAGVGGQARS